jgi:phosphopantetheine--protein transferase-like protein
VEAAGMVGSESKHTVIAQLGKILRRDVVSTESITLRSIHRATFSAWARQEKLPLALDLVASGNPFTVDELFSAEPYSSSSPTFAPAPQQESAPALPSAAFQIGIDVEDVESLPDTDDYRSHLFFQENFSSKEIAHCVQQTNARASFCGVWAAKEAIIKAGAASPAPGLRHIEITYDSSGKPSHRGCMISISHSPAVAVAVCLVLEVIVPERAKEIPPAVPERQAAPARRWPWSQRAS